MVVSEERCRQGVGAGGVRGGLGLCAGLSQGGPELGYVLGVTRPERRPRLESLPGDLAPEALGIRATASGMWSGWEDKRWSRAPACLVPANTISAPPLARRPPAGLLSPVRKQTLEEGAPVWQELAHARLPGRDCQGRATLCWVRGEGRRAAAERGAPAPSSQVSSCAVGRGQCVGPVNRR